VAIISWHVTPNAHMPYSPTVPDQASARSLSSEGHGSSLDPRDHSLHFADGPLDSGGVYSDSGSDADGPPAAAWKCYVATLIVYLLLVGLGDLLAPPTRMGWVVLVALGLILVSGPLFSHCMNSTISAIVHKAIERFDKRHLGVDIDVGHITSHLGRGYVSVHNFVIHNPEGGVEPYDASAGIFCYPVSHRKCKSPYLLNARDVVIDVDVWMYIRSFGKRIEIENIVFRHVDLICEKTWSSSNIHEVLGYLEAKIQGGGKKEKKQQTELVLRRVVVEDVGLRVEAQMLGGFGMRVESSDIKYHDFATEVGECMANEVAR
ncbi:unnamed protein product, partial [Polarella glacialis]